MRTQSVRYAVLEVDYAGSPVMKGTGYTDKARFIFQFGNTAFLFGEHEGRTLVAEVLTSGFLFRCRLLQTKAP
jgi:hypothetical protein